MFAFYKTNSMKLIISGITGLIGRHLSHRLQNDYEIIGLTRSPEKHRKEFASAIKLEAWDARTSEGWAHHLSDEYAIINLAGEPIAASRWTASQKRRIIDSRINSVAAITEAIQKANNRPKVIVQGSATGYYGQSPDEEFTEDSGPGTGFLAETTVRWEEATSDIKKADIRMPLLRTGVVLSTGGGALPSLLLPFRFMAGGYIGSGKQWLSWIHLEDEIRAIQFLLEHETADGPFNLTAPNPVTMKTMTKTAGKVLGKPSWTKAPAFIIELMMGQMAKEMLIKGTKATPKKLLQLGFQFKHPDLESALNDLLQ